MRKHEIKVACRHRKMWVLGSSYLWCWACGALRRVEQGNGNSVVPIKGEGWVRPAGPTGKNPAKGVYSEKV